MQFLTNTDISEDFLHKFCDIPIWLWTIAPAHSLHV